MKNVVMGTAGHIDHGKTALVKRLTGVDTDRLEEEKRRGMTIELGFAPLTLPSGNVVSIIDVPGHEKFIKAMVAGVTGIDFVMLVVAADEGVMPQTVEHINILSLLNVKNGVVALTKSDLVEDDWLEMALEDVAKALTGTSLEGSPVVAVSSVTGTGIDELVAMLEKLTAQAAGGLTGELFRMPIDRVFTMTGYGTVITGTITGGKVTKGDILEILPSGRTARIRGIQVHNQNTEEAASGDRCALNLSGVDKTDIKRGDVAALQGNIKSTKLVDAVVYTVAGKEGIAHNQRVHVHAGTKEVLARVRVLGTEAIPGGSKGYVQLRFEEPVVVIRKDRFIIRSYSPVDIVGGGWIIFHSTENHQRFSEETTSFLTVGENGSLNEVIDLVLKASGKILSLDEIWQKTFEDKQEMGTILAQEQAKGQVVQLKETNKYLSKELYQKFADEINAEFEQLYKKYPFRYQIDREELKSRVFNNFDLKDFAALMNDFIDNNIFEITGNFIMQPGTQAIDRIMSHKYTGMLEGAIKEYGLNPVSAMQLQLSLKIEVANIEEIERFLVKTGRIIDLGEGILVHEAHFKTAVSKVKQLLDKQGECTASQVRDWLEVSRKTAIALLEHLDSLQITERVDDVRKPGVRFMDY